VLAAHNVTPVAVPALTGAKGLAKEAVGSVVGNKNLEEEGEAQQDKAQAQRDAAKKEAEAEAARAGAATAEKRQQSHHN